MTLTLRVVEINWLSNRRKINGRVLEYQAKDWHFIEPVQIILSFIDDIFIKGREHLFLAAKLLYKYKCTSVCPSVRQPRFGGNVIFSAPI